MASLELPFPRGTTWDSGSLGPVPKNILGSVYDLGDGTRLQICRNVDPAALVGGRISRLNASGGSAAVNECSGAGDIRNYGVCDPAYADAGVTVPANSLFYNQVAGITRIRAGASMNAGVAITPHATDGHYGVATTISVAPMAVVGTLLANTASGALGRVLMRPVI